MSLEDIMKKTVRVVGAVIVENGKILCAQRGPDNLSFTVTPRSLLDFVDRLLPVSLSSLIKGNPPTI